MRLALLPSVLLLATACGSEVEDNAVPPPAAIEQLEQRLARHPCVSNLDEWERNYRYSRKAGLFTQYSLNPDFDVIEFHLRRAGSVTITAGRNVVQSPPDGDWPDSRPIEAIDGRFTLSSGSLRLAGCARRQG
jgi:hypothetical protein